MKRFSAFFIMIAALAFMPSLAFAQRVDSMPGQGQDAPTGAADRIAAVVNDNIISTVDLEDRVRLALLSAGLPENSENIHRLVPQVLRGLVDEQLELQEAKRVDVTVSNEEIDAAMDRIAKDNNMTGGMKAFIISRGASVDALIAQLRGALSWNKVIQRELRPRIDVGDDEVDAAIERIRANAGKEEFLVNEIFLAVDNPKDEDQVRQFADSLVQQLKDGANFGAVARQFSQGTGAASGGDIGWIQEGQLPKELDHALAGLKSGEIAGPIRSTSGYHILGLRDKRTIAMGNGGGSLTLNLQQAFKPYDSVSKDAVMQEALRIHTAISSCANLQGQMTDQFPSWKLHDMGQADLAKVPSWISDKVRDLSAGKASDAVATDRGAVIFFVCDRHVPDNGIDRNAVVATIGTEKLELQARRLLRDLRQSAYIDVRLGSGS